MARIHVRLAREADIPALEAFQRESVTRSCSSVFEDEEREAYLRLALDVDRQLIADGTYYVACFGSRVIGFGGWSDRRRLEAEAAGQEAQALDPKTDPAWIRAVYVDPRHLDTAVGARLLGVCEYAARAAGFASAELFSCRAARRLFELAGYESVAEVSLEARDQVSIPLIRMRIRLEADRIVAPRRAA